MYSFWSNPLPSDEGAKKPAVIYYYEGKWVPVMFLDFTQALLLYKKVTGEGWDVLIFPANCHPNKLGWSGKLFSPVEASRAILTGISPS